MLYIQQIMNYFNIDEAFAREIDAMIFLDRSECSQEEWVWHMEYAMNKFLDEAV